MDTKGVPGCNGVKFECMCSLGESFCDSVILVHIWLIVCVEMLTCGGLLLPGTSGMKILIILPIFSKLLPHWQGTLLYSPGLVSLRFVCCSAPKGAQLGRNTCGGI